MLKNENKLRKFNQIKLICIRINLWFHWIKKASGKIAVKKNL